MLFFIPVTLYGELIQRIAVGRQTILHKIPELRQFPGELFKLCLYDLLCRPKFASKLSVAPSSAA